MNERGFLPSAVAASRPRGLQFSQLGRSMLEKIRPPPFLGQITHCCIGVIKVSLPGSILMNPFLYKCLKMHKNRGSRGKLAGKSVFLQIIGNDNANISAFSPQHTY